MSWAWIPLLAAIVAGLATSTARAESSAQGVSPGRLEDAAPIDTRCPTFSWVAQPEATSYELVVLEWAPGPVEGEPALRQPIPGGATSWTPALDQCLEWGGSYAWSVRAHGAESGWSELLLFQVAGPDASLVGGSEAAEERAAERSRGREAGEEAASTTPLAEPSPQAQPTTAMGEPPSAPAAPASEQLMIGGVPVTLQSYDHSLVFDKLSGGVPQATTTSFVELASVSIELDSRCVTPVFVTRWNLLVMANAVAFSLDASDPVTGDLAVSVDDPTGTNVTNSDVQSFAVNGLLEDVELAGISLFTMLEDVAAGTREVSLLARRSNLGSASIGFDNYRLGVMALGFDCELVFPP